MQLKYKEGASQIFRQYSALQRNQVMKMMMIVVVVVVGSFGYWWWWFVVMVVVMIMVKILQYQTRMKLNCNLHLTFIFSCWNVLLMNITYLGCSVETLEFYTRFKIRKVKREENENCDCISFQYSAFSVCNLNAGVFQRGHFHFGD